MERGIVGYVVAGYGLVRHGIEDRWTTGEISGTLREPWAR